MSASATRRWAIVGPGNIATRFAPELAAVPGVRIEAVVSRSLARSRRFADVVGAARAITDVAQLTADDVDAAYVATPHLVHHESVETLLANGVAVLCEKPLSISRALAAPMVAASHRHNVTLMEAMWTRHVPAVVEFRRRLARGDFGAPRVLDASLGMVATTGEARYTLSRERGGGVLLDAGIYPLSFASMVFAGPPERVSGVARVEGGVDVHESVSLGFGAGVASIVASFVCNLPMRLEVTGETATVSLGRRVFNPTTMTIHHNSGAVEVIDVPTIGTGFGYQVTEMHRCLDSGLVESPVLPHTELLDILDVTDTLRRRWGVEYPSERGC